MYLEHSVGGAEAPNRSRGRAGLVGRAANQGVRCSEGRDERRVIFWKGKKKKRNRTGGLELATRKNNKRTLQQQA